MPKPSGDLKAKKRAQTDQAGNTHRRVKRTGKILANRRLRAQTTDRLRRELRNGGAA